MATRAQDQSDEATIYDIPVDLNAPLTVDVKKALQKIIEDEYNNQTTLTQEQEKRAREETIRDYQERYDTATLATDYRAAKDKADAILQKLNQMGFDSDGDWVGEQSYKGITLNAKGKAVKEALSNVSTRFQEPRTEKNKLMTRLMLARTNREALAIARAVMGNGLLPSIPQLPAPEGS